MPTGGLTAWNGPSPTSKSDRGSYESLGRPEPHQMNDLSNCTVAGVIPKIHISEEERILAAQSVLSLSVFLLFEGEVPLLFTGLLLCFLTFFGDFDSLLTLAGVFLRFTIFSRRSIAS